MPPLLRGLLRRGPLYAMVQVTARCNLHCRMCRVWTLEHHHPYELPTEAFGAMARELRRTGVRAVTLAGEPLLRDDLPALVAAFSRAGHRVRIQTNGTLADVPTVRALLHAGLNGISISLHTLDPDRMAWLTGRDDALERVLAGIEAIRTAARGRRGFLPVINLVVYGGNVDAIPRVLDYAAARGFRLSLIPIHTSSVRQQEPQFASRLPPPFPLEGAALQRLRAQLPLLVQRRREGLLLNSTRYLHLLERYLAGEAPGWPCLAGTTYVFVDHRGHVAPCHELDPVGSIFDPAVLQSLRRGDLGGSSRRQRSRCPGCLLPCWTELSLASTHPRSFLEAVEVNLPRPFRDRGSPSAGEPSSSAAGSVGDRPARTAEDDPRKGEVP